MLVGSSQGAAATFNAAVDLPQICESLCVMDPVSHDCSRFDAISVPCLLFYDVDDPGHPVSVGRVVKRKVKVPIYFEYSSRLDPDWIDTHMCAEMCPVLRALLNTLEHGRGNCGCQVASQGTARGTAHHESSSKAHAVMGGVLSWLKPEGKEVGISQPWHRAQLTRGLTTCEEAGLDQRKEFFRPEESSDPAQRGEQESADEKAQREAIEAQQTVCDCCGADPVRLVSRNNNPARSQLPSLGGSGTAAGSGASGSSSQDTPVCRHALCGTCFVSTSAINPLECPVVGCGFRGTENLWVPIHREGEPIVLPSLSKPGTMVFEIEFGNTATPPDDSGRVESTVFFRVLRVNNVASKSSTQKCIQSVAFNINPSYPKSAVKVSAPGPFHLTRTMASKFPADFIVGFKPELNLPTLWITYQVQHALPTWSRKLVVIAPANGVSKAHQKKEVVFKWFGRDLSSPLISVLHIE